MNLSMENLFQCHIDVSRVLLECTCYFLHLHIWICYPCSKEDNRVFRSRMFMNEKNE